MKLFINLHHHHHNNNNNNNINNHCYHDLIIFIILVLQPDSRLDRPKTLLDSILLAASVRPCLFRPAFSLGVSRQELFYEVIEAASHPTTVWWIRPPYLCPPETGWSIYTPGHWVSILVASYDTRGRRCGYFVPVTT